MAADYLCAHASSRGVKSWDPSALDRKLQKLGFGLLLVEGSRVFEHLAPVFNPVAAPKIDEVLAKFSGKTSLIARVARAS